MGILNSGLRRLALMTLALSAALPAQAQYPFETTVEKEEERFQAIIKNHSGNASFEFIQGITLEVQWWELLGEPVNYYKLKWNRGTNFQLPSGTTRDDLSKYPDLLRRFDAMKPLSFEFEIDFELKDMKPNCGPTIKDTDTFARGSRFVNSTKHLLIGKNGEVQSSLSPGSGSWADFATWLNDETYSPEVVKKTFVCATTLTLYKISTLKAEIPEREIAAIDAAYAKREKEKEQKAEEEKKKKEDKLKDLAARLNGEKKAAAPDSSSDGIAGRLLNAEKKLEARLEAERKAREEAERRRLEEERRQRELEAQINKCNSSAFTGWNHTYGTCEKRSLKDSDLRISDTFTVATKKVKITVVDHNSAQDDDYQLFVNEKYIGDVKNITGGSTTLTANLQSGENLIELRLLRDRGNGTGLKLQISPGNYESQFNGTHNHSYIINVIE
ncbi:hypothetical protein KFE96_06195 [Kordiimonas sp. SCSIO 12603]|uniref:hypothetical protein n=1 Tax=Kordiimonas sp. SCSIO 12603 TaxID=2829596 RepID=UPI002103247C|nr:hypothetical protein [Kordiimonas sp. SCSIO 12603]UTW59890.1 hypothetical protein KFE96_06195 [Kordiimonas sp. SCSIO 12603]